MSAVAPLLALLLAGSAIAASPRAPITALAFAPGGAFLVATSQQGLAIYASNGETLALRARHPSAMPNLHALAFRPDGRMLAVGGGAPGESGAVELREWPGGCLLRTLDGHADLVMAVAFSPDGKRLASGSADHTLRLWDLESDDGPVLKGHAGPVLAAAFSPDGNWLASGSADHSVKLWEAATGALRRTLAQHTGAVEAVAFAPDGRTMATAGADGTARVWQPEIVRLVRTIRGHNAPIRDLAGTPRGILTAADDGRVRLLALDSDAILHTFPAAPGPLYALAVSPDGRTVAASGAAGSVHRFRLPVGHPPRASE